MKSKVIISLLETVRLSVSILLRNLYNSLKTIKESAVLGGVAEVENSNLTVGHKIFFQHLPGRLIYYISPYQSSLAGPHSAIGRAPDS